jgi:RES domain-containing protein
MAAARFAPLIPHPDCSRIERELRKAVSICAPWSGVIYRAVSIDYANRRDLVSGEGSKAHGSRWTPIGSYPAVYGSLDPHTALLETIATARHYGVPADKRMPLVIVAVDVGVQRLLDLTVAALRRRLKLSRAALTVDWEASQRCGNESYTQAIGRLAYELDVQGLLVPSARVKGAKNLIAFPDALAKGSLRIQNVKKLPDPAVKLRRRP